MKAMAFEVSEGEHLFKEAHQSPIEKALNFIRKPSSFIILILVCVILTLTLQFGALQHQVDLLSKKVKDEAHSEHQMASRVRGLQSEVRHLEKEEHELEKKEKKLEDKEQKLESHKDSWGEGHHHAPDIENIHMHSLVPHVTPSPLDSLFGALFGLGEGLKGKMENARKTGPAKDHHMGPIVPTHNLLKPGAHPSHNHKEEEDKKKAKDHKDDHHAKNLDGKKDEHKKDEKKKEEPAKQDMKPKKIE